jgi:hypothetical protein
MFSAVPFFFNETITKLHLFIALLARTIKQYLVSAKVAKDEEEVLALLR